MPIPTPPAPAAGDQPSQLTPGQIADAIARAQKIQSVGGSLLSNATQLKQLLEQLAADEEA